MSDNFHLDITGAALDKCLDIAFGGGAPGNKTSHWSTMEPGEKSHEAVWGANKAGSRLVLFWSKPETSVEALAFLTPLTAEQVEPIVKAWLAEQNYGSQPDHDGDNGKGWRVYNEAWGHVGGSRYAICGIEPVWLEYGK